MVPLLPSIICRHPQELVEVKFFGYETGSFYRGPSKAGCRVNLSTATAPVCQDEIGEIPLEMQPKLYGCWMRIR